MSSQTKLKYHLIFVTKYRKPILDEEITYHAWQNFGPRLRKTYWYKNLFWSSGYFCSTTGDASSETVKLYIETQGD